MPRFPLFIDLSGQPVLLVGGGAVALRKARKLQPYGPALTLVAPDIAPELAALPGLTLRRRSFRPEDLEPRPTLVIAATGDRVVNHTVATLCKERHIPVNVVDDPAACTFLFPALVTRGEFSAGISTGGASPTAAAYFKDRLSDALPDRLEDILTWLEGQRPALKEAVPDQAARAGLFRTLFDACMEKGSPLTAEEAETLIRGARTPVGTVALVGAGCGKADLITLRGLRLLRQCQAVVYDDLIDPALLDLPPESALRIYVGKRSGSHSASQQEINAPPLSRARAGRRVVRLKGGDPYLFGRGGEEMQALLAAGIPCQEVPGIPSAIGIPAEAGIPVTHRGISRGVHIVTAHTAGTPDGLPEDLDELAHLSGTLVFLMGLSRLPTLTRRLMAAGMDGNTPAAVLSGGNSPHPARVRAPLSRIARAAEEQGVVSPAIILVGEVAAMDLNARPLAGVRVGVTGTAAVAGRQREALTALGAEVIWIARSEVQELDFPLPDLTDGRPRWLVFTSANGVRSFFRKVPPDSVHSCRLAVIGRATGRALEELGLAPDLCPEVFTSEALGHALASHAAPGEESLLLRSAAGSPVLPRILAQADLPVRDIPVYDVAAEGEVPPLPGLDYLTFSSAGGVSLFLRQYGAIPDGVRCACIGSVTAEALAPHTDRPPLVAGEASVPALAAAILADR